PASVCSKNLPYVWNGTNYNTSGSYTQTFTNTAGCDSVATLVLTVLNETTSSTPASVCTKNLPYIWNGTNYNASGNYTKTFTNAAGCDSVATLVLTVLNETTSSTSASVCTKDVPYVWNGTNYNARGNYTQTFTNAAGCHSVATLVLTVLNETTSSTPASPCTKDLPYVWNGTNYNASGNYTQTLTNAAGCDSVATLV